MNMSWIDEHLKPGLSGAMALRPNLKADLDAFSETFWRESVLAPELLEVCRLRVAQLHRCQPELMQRRAEAKAVGFGEEHVEALSSWDRSDLFSAVQKDALALTELFVQDPSAIDDQLAARLTSAVGDAGFVALLEALALFDGFCRFQCMLEVAA